MKHPQINFEIQVEPTKEEVFAGRMITLLRAYKNNTNEMQDGFQVTYPVTDRVDIVADDEMIAGAFRIRRLRSLALADVPTAKDKPLKLMTAEAYTVLAFEYGMYQGRSGVWGATDDDFNWRPYVMSVSGSETNTTDLLDGATGKQLSISDHGKAAKRLDFFARQISDEAHERIVRGYDNQIAVESLPVAVGAIDSTPNNVIPLFRPRTR